MENYDEFTSLLDPAQKKPIIITKNSKFQFLKTLTPFMFLQASVGICASLQVNYILFLCLDSMNINEKLYIISPLDSINMF